MELLGLPWEAPLGSSARFGQTRLAWGFLAAPTAPLSLPVLNMLWQHISQF